MVHLRKQRWLRFSLRSVFEAVFVLAAGLAGARSVYTGEAQGWPDFQIRSGYWGTHFLDSYLYATGSQAVAMAIVATCWTLYTALPALAVVLLLRICFPGRQRIPTAP